MSMLQELLNLGLVEIGADDSRFEKMQNAASALAKRFGEDHGLLITATLVTLDEDVDEDDPFFELIEELAIREWKTLRNTHVNRPRQLLRAIAIDALAAAIDGSPEICGVVWNTAASQWQHAQVRLGKAADLVESLLQQAFEKAESEALQRAGMSPPVKKRRRTKKTTPPPSDPQLKATISASELLNDVARAAGPQHPQGQGLQDPNPHWTNQAQNWSYEFTPRMTAALVKAVNLGTSRLTESIGKDLAAYLTAFEKHLLDQLAAVETLQVKTTQARSSGRMRLDVLWWSKALYSASLRCSYTELSVAVAPFVAAVDLTAIVPPLAPASVTHVLREAVIGFNRGNGQRRPIAEYLLKLAEAAPDLGDLLPSSTSNVVRVPLLELASEAAGGSSIPADAVRSRAGVDGTLALTPADFSTWLFRDLQARRIVENLS